jgi:hypothetical protein
LRGWPEPVFEGYGCCWAHFFEVTATFFQVFRFSGFESTRGEALTPACYRYYTPVYYRYYRVLLGTKGGDNSRKTGAVSLLRLLEVLVVGHFFINDKGRSYPGS